jgi:chromosome segregation ATPase
MAETNVNVPDKHDDSAKFYFGDREPEYNAMKEKHEEDANHYVRENHNFKTEQLTLIEQKTQLEHRINDTLDQSSQLLRQLKHEVDEMKQIEDSKTDLYSRQLDKNITINTEQANIDEYTSNILELERELASHEQIREKLNIEQQKLQEKLFNIRDKETENANIQDYLQLSQKELQRQIEQIAQELKKNEAILSEEMARRKEYERKVEELRKEIEQKEDKIKMIEKEYERINEHQRLLQQEQKNLEKQIDQLNRNIVKSETILKHKQEKVTRLEKEVQQCQETIKVLEKEVKELHEKIQEINEQLEKVKQELISAEARLTQFDEERKRFENEKREIEKTLQRLEDEQTKNQNKLNRLQQKLSSAQELFDRANINIQQLKQQKEQQLTEIKQFEEERERLDKELVELKEKCNELREKRDQALQAGQNTETEHKEAKRAYDELKKLEREHSYQHEKAVNEEKRLQAQLNQAQSEETRATQEVAVAEAKVKSLEKIELLWSALSGVPIPFLSGIATSKTQELTNARANLEKVRSIHECKKIDLNKLLNQHSEVKDRVSESQRQHNDTKEELQSKNLTVLKMTALLIKTKSNVEDLTVQHRNASRKQKQAETDLRIIDNDVQRVRTQLDTTRNDLQHNQQEKLTYENQMNDLKLNIETLTEEIQEHQSTMNERLVNKEENQKALFNVIQQCERQKSNIQTTKGIC